MEKFQPGSKARTQAGFILAAIAILFSSGCQDYRGPVSITSDDPDLQILAIKGDASKDNARDIPKLVEDLQSDDPAIRFYSIEALRQLTHEDFGYHYYETDDERAPALARWQSWLKRMQPTPQDARRIGT